MQFAEGQGAMHRYRSVVQPGSCYLRRQWLRDLNIKDRRITRGWTSARGLLLLYVLQSSRPRTITPAIKMIYILQAVII